MKIAILGAGAFGTALGGILAENGYDIDYYDSKTEKERLSDVLLNTKLIVLSVPSAVAPYLLPYLPKNIPIIVATKGLLSDAYFSGFDDFMVLSGPGFAKDIKSHKNTLLTATDKRIISLFETDYLHFDFTKDKKGVLMCGALKNVYAIYAGLLNLVPGEEEHQKFLDEVSLEMMDLLKLNGADPKTVDLSCGRGDLKITCYFPSRNYEFGQKIRLDENYRANNTVEGISALRKIMRGEIKIPETAHYLKQLINLVKTKYSDCFSEKS